MKSGRTKINVIIFIIILMCIGMSLNTFAQGTPPGPPTDNPLGGNRNNNDIPIDINVGFLVSAGVAFGLYFFNKKRKS